MARPPRRRATLTRVRIQSRRRCHDPFSQAVVTALADLRIGGPWAITLAHSPLLVGDDLYGDVELHLGVHLGMDQVSTEVLDCLVG